MTKILDPQYGNNFVGRGKEIKELEEKIENNGIVIVTGDRGIGKTNLIFVVKEDVKKEKECHHIPKGSLFYDRMSEIFKPSLLSRITGISSPFGGISWDPGKNPLLEYMVKSKERIIFVEDAHELDRKAIDLIFDASRRNERLRFILEIATPYKPAEKLGKRSYEPFEVKELSNKSTTKLLKGIYPDFLDEIVRKIVSLSRGYPYVARSLAYICDNKNTEEEIFEFLKSLRDDTMKYNLDQIQKEVLKTLNEDAERVVKRLAIAPPVLTLRLIVAFCKGMPADLNTPLSDLLDRGILVKEDEDGKKLYKIYHPLFREYLRSEDVQPLALENRKEYYRKAMERVKSEFDSIFILLEVLNEPDIFEELIKQTENYEVINSVGTQAYTWGKLEQALCAWNHLLEKTKGVDKEWESIAMGDIGNVYRIKGEVDTALEYFEKALKLNEDFGIKEGMARDLGNIGNVYQIKGELDKALKYYEVALRIFKDMGNRIETAQTLVDIGNVFALKGDKEQALNYYREAKSLAKGSSVFEDVNKKLKRLGEE